MTYQNCPGIAEVTFYFSQDGQVMVNVFHAMKSTAWGLADLQALYTKAVDFINFQWGNIATSDCSFVGAKCVDLSTSSGPVYQPPLGGAIAGGVLTGPLPTNVTCVASLHTAKRGRSYRGRIYHCGLPAESVVDSMITIASQSSIQAAYEYLRGNLESSPGRMCVLSRRNGGALRAEGVGEEVTSVTVDFNADSQRRRLPGRGT